MGFLREFLREAGLQTGSKRTEFPPRRATILSLAPERESTGPSVPWTCSRRGLAESGSTNLEPAVGRRLIPDLDQPLRASPAAKRGPFPRGLPGHLLRHPTWPPTWTCLAMMEPLIFSKVAAGTILLVQANRSSRDTTPARR